GATKNYVDNAVAGNASTLTTKLDLTGGTMSGLIDMGTNPIQNLVDPTNPQDGATKNYVDNANATMLPLAGGTITGPLLMANEQALQLAENGGNGVEKISLKAPNALAADYTLTLPTDAGTASQVLSTDGSGVLSWVASGGAPSGAAGGSLAGSYPSPTLAASSVSTAEIVDGTIGTVDLANSSVSAAKLVDTYLNIDGTGAMTGVLLGNIGTQAAPGYTFSGDTDTGIYRNAVDKLGFSTAGASRMIIDATGNVGIGTNTPASLLHVVGASGIRAEQICDETGTNCQDISAGWATGDLMANGSMAMTGNFQLSSNNIIGVASIQSSAGSAAAPSYTFTADTNTGIYSPSADNLALATGGVERLSVSPSGGIGIGIASPPASAILEISSTTQGFLMPRMTTAQMNGISTPDNGLHIYNTTTNSMHFYNGSAWINSAGGAGFAADGSTPMTGQFRAIATSGSASPAISFNGDTDTGMFSAGPDKIGFSVNGLQEVVIQSASGTNSPVLSFKGDLGSGITAGTSATVTMIISNNKIADFTTQGIAVSGSNAGPHYSFLGDLNSGMSSMGPNQLGFATNNVERLRIDGAGRVGIGTNIPSENLHIVGNLRVQGGTDCTLGNGAGATNCTSDKRLKDQVTPISGAVSKIKRLKGVEFVWNEKSSSPGRKDIGVIAQDIKSVFPTAVITQKGTGYLQVDYAVLVAPLIQATKEQQESIETNLAMIKTMQGELEQLKKENEALRERVANLEKGSRDIASIKAENKKMKERFERLEIMLHRQMISKNAKLDLNK
ncbi:MAG: cell division protein FtsB, partial [Bacteriovoracaceae bacterium]